MRFVVLDTETTGINKSRGASVCDGHSLVEIGCVEILDGVVTGEKFHSYLKPRHQVSPGAVAIHGLTDAFLNDKPLFKDIVPGLLGFISGSSVVIHNAPFDIAFLDQEFELLSGTERPVGVFKVIDTLALARGVFPGVGNRLDDLCVRLSLKGRLYNKFHGALLDAFVLAEVFISLLSFLV